MYKIDKNLAYAIFKIVDNRQKASFTEIKNELTGNTAQAETKLTLLEKARSKRIVEIQSLNNELIQLGSSKNRRSYKTERKKEVKIKMVEITKDVEPIDCEIAEIEKQVKEIKENAYCNKIADKKLTTHINFLLNQWSLVKKTVTTENGSSHIFYSPSPYVKPGHDYAIMGYGEYGIDRIKDREKAKELFFPHLRLLSDQLISGILGKIANFAFSPEGQKVIDRTKKGEYCNQIFDYVYEIVKKDKQFDFSRDLTGFIVELLSNADVAFGEHVCDKNSVFQKFIIEPFQKQDLVLERIRYSEEVFDILDKQEPDKALDQKLFEEYMKKIEAENL